MHIFSSKQFPQFAVIDVETTEIRDGEIPQTKFWGFADERGYERFQTTRQLIRFLRATPPRVLLHHTNFDILQLLVDGFTDINILRSHNGKLIRCIIGQHTTQNTFTVFPEKLEKLFKPFGFAKSSLNNLDRRNYEDCVNGLSTFIQLNDLFFNLVGVYPLSVGTVAGTTFRAAEMAVGKMPKDLRFLSAYRGGRVEVFDTNRVEASLFDINSSYPRSFLEVGETEELWHVRVTTRDYVCPLFDAKEHSMLLFPNGKFDSWVFKSNFERYIEPNMERTKIRVLSKHKIVTKWLYNLRGLVQDIYSKKRENGDNAIGKVCKFLLNAFYGRIGLKPETERAMILDYEPYGKNVEAWKIGGSRWLCFDKMEREVRSNYGFAAFVTDNARARLYQSFVRNSAIYGDTDSVFTLATPDKFSEPTGDGCGDFNFKKRRTFQARNVKDYEFDGEETVKGGTPGKPFTTWNVKRFAQGKTAIATTRSRVTELRKRRILPNGKTEPLTVNN